MDRERVWLAKNVATKSSLLPWEYSRREVFKALQPGKLPRQPAFRRQWYFATSPRKKNFTPRFLTIRPVLQEASLNRPKWWLTLLVTKTTVACLKGLPLGRFNITRTTRHFKGF